MNMQLDFKSTEVKICTEPYKSAKMLLIEPITGGNL